jgi:hypothetical protein
MARFADFAALAPGRGLPPQFESVRPSPETVGKTYASTIPFSLPELVVFDAIFCALKQSGSFLRLSICLGVLQPGPEHRRLEQRERS